LRPEVEAASHPEAGRARKRNGPPDLRREAPFDRFEERPARLRVLLERANGSATSVMNATPPIQCVTKRTCNARASSM
jgi:hypothetical protein